MDVKVFARNVGEQSVALATSDGSSYFSTIRSASELELICNFFTEEIFYKELIKVIPPKSTLRPVIINPSETCQLFEISRYEVFDFNAVSSVNFRYLVEEGLASRYNLLPLDLEIELVSAKEFFKNQ